MPTEYRHTRRVQFYETDAAGIVHFSWFFRYMEEAEHAMWRAAGLSIHPPGSDIGWPRVAASFEYHRALKFEDEFDVVLHVEHIAAKSIRYVCEITQDGDKVATGSLTVVCVRRKDGERARAAEIPQDVVLKLTT